MDPRCPAGKSGSLQQRKEGGVGGRAELRGSLSKSEAVDDTRAARHGCLGCWSTPPQRSQGARAPSIIMTSQCFFFFLKANLFFREGSLFFLFFFSGAKIFSFTSQKSSLLALKWPQCSISRFQFLVELAVYFPLLSMTWN